MVMVGAGRKTIEAEKQLVLWPVAPIDVKKCNAM
jgi:hypothetical protein